jgi:O-antigen/teichoic acid export membrane protein
MSIAKHTGYNLLGAAIPILVSLATVPLYLHLVGLERFGILSICWLLLGYFGLFDLGLSRAVAQKIAALGKDDAGAGSQIFWTAFWISGVLALLAGAIMLPAAFYALRYISFDTAGLAAEAASAVPWLALTVPVSLMSGLFTGALTGRERFGLINLGEGLATTLSAVVPLAVAWLAGPDLWLLIAAALGGRVLAALLLFAACFRAIPLHAPVRPHRDLVKALGAYGGWVSVGAIVAPLLAFWDRFAIGWMLGAVSVSVYVVAFTLVWRLATIPSALSRALFPRFAAQEDGDAHRLHLDGLGVLAFLMTPAILVAILFVRPFLDLWVGSALGREAAPLAYILLPAIWLNGFAQIAYSRLQAQGRPGTVARIHLIEIVPYLLCLLGGLALFGLAGAALVWTLRVVADTALLFGALPGGLASLKRLAGQGLLILIAAGGAFAAMDWRWPWFVAAILPLGVWAAYQGLPDGARNSVRAMLRKVGLSGLMKARNGQ